jgi:hypothetical protein
MKPLLFLTILVGCLLAVGCDKTSSAAPSITRSIPGAWRTESVKQDGTERTIYYLPLTQSIDYSKISAPGDVNSPDLFKVLEGLIFYWQSAQPQQFKAYFASGDPLQQIDSAKLGQLLGHATGREDWRMTHLVCVGELIIVRGSFLDRAKGKREVDLWPFSQVQGKWRAHILSPEAKSVEWLMKLLYQDAITFSP